MSELGELHGTSVLVRHDTGGWHPPEIKAYTDEAHLEGLLAEEPRLLPGLGGDAVAVRQLYVPNTGPTDVVAVDSEGSITVCECKLASNPEIRRSVIGQVFAYAAGLWNLSYDDFDTAWRARAGGSSLISSVNADADDETQEAFRGAVANNLATGRFRLVLAVDAITPELRRTVEFLNAHTGPDTSIVALELGYGSEAGVEVLVPRVYGIELAATKARTPGRRWTEDDLYEAIAGVAPDAVEPFKSLLDRYRSRVAYYYMGEGSSPSATAIVQQPVECQPFTVSLGSNWAGVRVNFDWLHRLGNEQRKTLLDRLSESPAIAPELSEVLEANFRKRPMLFWADTLSHGDAFKALMAGFDELFAGLGPAGAT